MAKKETRTLALAVGHPTTWRQTVTVGTKDKPKRHQLVFQPNEDKEVTQEEIDGGLQPYIDSGLLVDPNRDPKGRQRRPRPADATADAAIAKLEKKVEDLAAENAKLTADNAQLKADLEAATAPA